MGRKSRFFHNYHGVICMATCALMSGNLHAAPSTSSNPFSQYGLIQGVRNYSSNPFWSPDAPYNMRMPVPVYVNGPDIDTGECQTVVANLVASTCAAMNNCRGTRLSDIRPSVMLALSRMPGNRNYATACMGYIDTAYSEYMKLNTGKLDSSARFPTYAIANPATNTASASTTTSAAPKWQTEMDARAAELESFHSQTTDPASLGSVPFPTTYADVPFEKRIENEKLGYEPFKDAKAYHEIKLEDTPSEGTSGDGTPGDGTPGGGTPGGGTPGGGTPGGGTPGGETPGGETPGGETPGGETPGGETPGGETPGGETPGDETPGESLPDDVVSLPEFSVEE